MKSQCAILSEIQVQNFDNNHWRCEEIKDQWWKHTFEILQPLFTIIPEWAFHFKMQAAEEPKSRASSTFFQLYNRKLLVNCIMQHGIKPHNLHSWFKGGLKLDWIQGSEVGFCFTTLEAHDPLYNYKVHIGFGMYTSKNTPICNMQSRVECA